MYFSVTPKLGEWQKKEFNDLLNELVNQFDVALRPMLRVSLLATHPDGWMEKIADSSLMENPDDYACQFIWTKGQEKGIAGLCASRHHTVFIPDLKDHPLAKYYVVLPEPHQSAGSIICVPVLDTSRKSDRFWHCIGVLNVSAPARNTLSNDDVNIVANFVSETFLERVRCSVAHLRDDRIETMRESSENSQGGMDNLDSVDLSALSAAVFRLLRDERSIDTAEVARDLQSMIEKNDHGRHSAHHHQRARVMASLFQGRETEAVSLEEIGMVLGDPQNNKAASLLVSRCNMDLDAIGSRYEIARTSAYYFRLKR